MNEVIFVEEGDKDYWMKSYFNACHYKRRGLEFAKTLYLQLKSFMDDLERIEWPKHEEERIPLSKYIKRWEKELNQA